ncbi:MAG: shikimate dehydrogenase [Pirellulales bacterium]
MSNISLQEIVCCLGQPVAGNPTQYMMEQAFAAAGLDWRYLTLEVAPANLSAALAGLRAMGFRGANLAWPHKQAAVPLLDELSESARLIQSVNCVHHRDGRLLGENTEGQGFLHALMPIGSPAGRHCEILGAGSVARAIAVELGLAGAASLRIVNRSAERGQELVNLLNSSPFAGRCPAVYQPWQGPHGCDPDVQLVVNATTVGRNGLDEIVDVDLDTLAPHMVVADVNLNSDTTQWLRSAADRGCTTLDGLGMLVQQSAICFRLWTGSAPNTAVMREALEEFLGF